MKILNVFVWSTAMFSIASYAAPSNDLALAEKELAPIFVKEAGAKITTEQGEEKEWRYPYFVGNTSSRLKQFNSWLRETSIHGLFPQDDVLAEKALKSKDSQVIAMLKTDKAVQDIAAEVATFSLDKRFGTLFFLTIQSTYRGVRYFINVDSVVYDYAAGKEINIANLFVGEAEQKLSDLLADSIHKTLEKAKRESRACLMKNKKNPGYSCPELNIDADQCINSALFHWGWLYIKDSRHLQYYVPYKPNVAADCGYEDSFEIHGPNVEALFLEPARFKKAVRFTVLPNVESQAKE